MKIDWLESFERKRWRTRWWFPVRADAKRIKSSAIVSVSFEITNINYITFVAFWVVCCSTGEIYRYYRRFVFIMSVCLNEFRSTNEGYMRCVRFLLAFATGPFVFVQSTGYNGKKNRDRFPSEPWTPTRKHTQFSVFVIFFRRLSRFELIKWNEVGFSSIN